MLSDTDHVPIYLAIIASLIALSFLFELSARAFDNANRTKLRDAADESGDGDAGYKKLEKILDDPARYRITSRFVSTGCILASAVLTWLLPFSGLGGQIAALIVLGICGTGLAYVLPMKLAYNHSDAVSYAMAGFQKFVNGLLFPLTILSEGIGNLILKLFREPTKMTDTLFSVEEVMSMIDEGTQSGQIMEESHKMIDSIFRFDDELAYEIMTPRTDVFLIDLEDDPSEYMDELLEMRYSRVPVCEGDSDNIIGILYLKDFMLQARKKGFDHVDLRSILRKPCFVPETKNIASLFIQLQQESQHFSVLIDEYGGFSGIVTMEDIIEEIVGDISDEYDVKEENSCVRIGTNAWLANGNVDIDDFDEMTGADLSSETSETLSGFVIDLIGEIPKDGYLNKTISYENYDFTIILVKERRIEKLRITIHDPDLVAQADEKAEKEKHHKKEAASDRPVREEDA